MNHFRQSKIYRHKFTTHLQTAHGNWRERESIVLREEDAHGRVSFGELCPTPGFVSFRLADLFPIVKDWENDGDISSNRLLSSAMSCIRSEVWDLPTVNHDFKEIFTAELFSSNTRLKNIVSVYKKKIGIFDIDREIENVHQLFDSIPPKSEVRLDANESLSTDELFKWNEAFKSESRLQFLEQPFKRTQIQQIFDLEKNLDISIALDESVVWKNDFSFFTRSAWEGFYVIKPHLLSDWNQTINFIKANPDRTIVSSVFESPFGFEGVCRCASYSNLFSGLDRNLFSSDEIELSEHHKQPIQVGNISTSMLDELWRKL